MKLRKHKTTVKQLPNSLDLLSLADGLGGKHLRAVEITGKLLGSLCLARNKSPKRHACLRHSLTVLTLQSA